MIGTVWWPTSCATIVQFTNHCTEVKSAASASPSDHAQLQLAHDSALQTFYLEDCTEDVYEAGPDESPVDHDIALTWWQTEALPKRLVLRPSLIVLGSSSWIRQEDEIQGLKAFNNGTSFLLLKWMLLLWVIRSASWHHWQWHSCQKALLLLQWRPWLYRKDH